MRKLFLAVFIFFSFLGCTAKANIKSEIVSFFENEGFVTEEHYMGGEKLLFSYLPSDKTNNCVYKAILYKEKGDSLVKYLVFDKNVISNSVGEIFKGEIVNQKYYGWKIQFVEKNNCISADFVTNSGKNITDGPTILFDNSDGLYKLYVQDRNQW